MWETLKGFIGPIISIISSLIGGGPLGLIGFGVGILGLIFGGIWIYNKYKNWVFSEAHSKQNDKAVSDHSKVIDKNIDHSNSDDKTFTHSKKSKENAFNPN